MRPSERLQNRTANGGESWRRAVTGILDELYLATRPPQPALLDDPSDPAVPGSRERWEPEVSRTAQAWDPLPGEVHPVAWQKIYNDGGVSLSHVRPNDSDEYSSRALYLRPPPQPSTREQLREAWKAGVRWAGGSNDIGEHAFNHWLSSHSGGNSATEDQQPKGD